MLQLAVFLATLEPAVSFRTNLPALNCRETFVQTSRREEYFEYEEEFRPRRDDRPFEEDEAQSVADDGRFFYEDDEEVDIELAAEFEEEDEYDEDYEYTPQPRQSPKDGNYWSNPVGGTSNRTRSTPRRRQRSSLSRPEARRPPAPVRSFYDRLFWYGVDPSDMAGPEDKTIFGGTKGKFNGLSYANPDLVVKRPRRRRPRNAPRDEVDEPRREDWEYEELGRRRSQRRHRHGDTPPQDLPNMRIDAWISQTVSQWFTPAPTVTSRRLKDDGAIKTAMDGIFGIDAEEYERKAIEYDRLVDFSTPAYGASSQPRTKRRKGYGDPFELEGDGSVIEIDEQAGPRTENDVVNTEVYANDERESGRPNDTSRDVEPLVNEEAEREAAAHLSAAKKQPELSWEERALAMERVPPVDVTAWGPSGDLGVNARAQAIIDALEDVAILRRRLAALKRKEERIRDELTVLRVDAEMERNRRPPHRMDSSSESAKLRAMDTKAESVSRQLRYTRLKVAETEKELIAMEARHWAVLSCYDADKAEEGVNSALHELEAIEPAAKRMLEKPNSESILSSTINDEKPH